MYGEYSYASGNPAYSEYIYLDGLVVASQTAVVGSTEPPIINYLYADHLGSVRAVLGTSGATLYTWPWLGNAFGEVGSAGVSGFNLRFPGQYFDEETGLEYNGARYYDSASGRFPQADPSGLRGGINPYVYGLNDPLTYFDPTGFAPTQPPMGPFPPEDPGRIPDASDIPGNVPGGPWTPAPNNSGQRPGTFLGPKQPKGPRAMCRWVPSEENGGSPGSTGYWESQQPGQNGWDRWNPTDGRWMSPEESHPGNPPPAEPSPPAEPPVTEPPVTEPPVVEPPIIDPIIP